MSYRGAVDGMRLISSPRVRLHIAAKRMSQAKGVQFGGVVCFRRWLLEARARRARRRSWVSVGLSHGDGGNGHSKLPEFAVLGNSPLRVEDMMERRPVGAIGRPFCGASRRGDARQRVRGDGSVHGFSRWFTRRLVVGFCRRTSRGLGRRASEGCRSSGVRPACCRCQGWFGGIGSDGDVGGRRRVFGGPAVLVRGWRAAVRGRFGER